MGHVASPSCIIVSLYNKSNCYCLPHWLLWLSRGHHVAYIMSSRRSSRHCHAPALSAAPARNAHSTWLASPEPPVRNLHKIMQNHAMRLVFVACPVKASPLFLSLALLLPLHLNLVWLLCAPECAHFMNGIARFIGCCMRRSDSPCRLCATCCRCWTLMKFVSITTFMPVACQVCFCLPVDCLLLSLSLSLLHSASLSSLSLPLSCLSLRIFLRSLQSLHHF